ncbi:MAG: tRNA (guanosine(37)-N1)-methyltransferase TrmD [Geminicoccaceae bacterium]
MIAPAATGPAMPETHATPWAAKVLTLFPEMLPGPLGYSLVGQALDQRLWSLEAVNIRDFATDRHRSVDDTPCGGGAGMVMRPDVVAAAIDHVAAEAPDLPRLYLTPRGRSLTQNRIEHLAKGPGVVVLCGRFEGVDQRVVEARSLEEVCLGDFVMSGGELAAMSLIDACVRLLPGVIGASASLAEESFTEDLLEYPQYTRPRMWEGHEVPDILLSGHHARIDEWRRSQSEAVTRARRPDLWARYLSRNAGPEAATSPPGAEMK